MKRTSSSSSPKSSWSKGPPQYSPSQLLTPGVQTESRRPSTTKGSVLSSSSTPKISNQSSTRPRGPPQNSFSQSSTPPTQTKLSHSRHPSTLDHGVLVRDGVRIPRNSVDAMAQGSTVTFGSIDDVPSPPTSALSVDPRLAKSSYISLLNGKASAASQSVENTSSTSVLSVPAATPSTLSASTDTSSTSTRPSSLPSWPSSNQQPLPSLLQTPSFTPFVVDDGGFRPQAGSSSSLPTGRFGPPPAQMQSPQVLGFPRYYFSGVPNQYSWYPVPSQVTPLPQHQRPSYTTPTPVLKHGPTYADSSGMISMSPSPSSALLGSGRLTDPSAFVFGATPPAGTRQDPPGTPTKKGRPVRIETLEQRRRWLEEEELKERHKTEASEERIRREGRLRLDGRIIEERLRIKEKKWIRKEEEKEREESEEMARLQMEEEKERQREGEEVKERLRREEEQSERGRRRHEEDEKKRKEEEERVAGERAREEECRKEEEEAKASAGIKRVLSDSGRKRPEPLDLTQPSRQPLSLLALARPLKDLGGVIYPEGVISPKPELNVGAKEGKFRYDRDFLLQFMSICKEKPESLPPLDAIGILSVEELSLTYDGQQLSGIPTILHTAPTPVSLSSSISHAPSSGMKDMPPTLSTLSSSFPGSVQLNASPTVIVPGGAAPPKKVTWKNSDDTEIILESLTKGSPVSPTPTTAGARQNHPGTRKSGLEHIEIPEQQRKQLEGEQQNVEAKENARKEKNRKKKERKKERKKKEEEQMRREEEGRELLTKDQIRKEGKEGHEMLQRDLQLDQDRSSLPSLLVLLRMERETPIGSKVNKTTIDLMCKVLQQNYNVVAFKPDAVSDVELLLDFILHLLDDGCLLNTTIQDANRKARRLMFKLFSNTPAIPKSFFLTEIATKMNLDFIDMGGFGYIFEGNYKGKHVALKLLYKGRNRYGSLLRDFYQEALVWRSLSHRYILPLLGIYEEKSRLYLVSPYMKNGTLAHWRKTHMPSIAEIQKRILEVAEGVQYIHSEGIVHGDLRGDNVLLDPSFHCQIADFGLTRHSDITVTRSTTTLSLNFAAPELFGMCHRCGQYECGCGGDDSDSDMAQRRKTLATDIYAFGCLHYEIYFDTLPFWKKGEFQIIQLVMNGSRPDRLDKPSMSDNMWDLIRRCWVSEPAKRPTMKYIVNTMESWS